MNTKITIVANPNTGNVITERTMTNKDGSTSVLGVIQLSQKSMTGLSGIGRVSKRTAFVTLGEDALEFMADSLVEGAEFPVAGRLVIEETLKGWVSKDGERSQDPKINPTTKDVITYKGQPVYRNTSFSEDVNAPDVFLKDSPAGSDSTAEAVTE